MPAAAAQPTTLAAIRAHLENVERGDIRRARMDYAEDGVREADIRGVVSLEGTFRDRAAIGRWPDNWLSSFEPGSYRFEVEKSIEDGDRVYLALSSSGRGEASGAETAPHLHHVFTLRNGLIVRHAFSDEPDEIRRAAGVATR